MLAHGMIGCSALAPLPSLERPESAPKLPEAFQVRRGPFVFCSDRDLQSSSAMLSEMEQLNERVLSELRLPASEQLVFVFLFAHRQKFEAYMLEHFQDLPSRRAFFVAYRNAQKGPIRCVFTYWGEQIQQDLRHELTHATLHSVLQEVPMWLDEGLAEYFEVPAAWQGLNYRHLEQFQAQGDQPWNPDLKRLDSLCDLAHMTLLDYQESWAWVHFMLQGPPEARTILLQYLQDLKHGTAKSSLESRLRQQLPNLEEIFRQHLIRLQLSTRNLESSHTP